MNAELRRRIDQKDRWTFKECLGLAADFDVKVRFVIALVLSEGKTYTDGESWVPPS
ncbi:MAG: hypothetical protein HN856_15490 [Gammaproteobacteria bacterium]|nr:hypothetical protein [Gammaproteobacteria bacterium]